MTKPLLPIRADGTHCYRDGNELRGKRTCTPAAVPSPEAEADARRADPLPGGLTVLVMRQGWGDRAHVVMLEDEEGHRAATVPRSFIRLRTTPGSHRLTARWKDQQASLDISGAAGEVMCVELIGSTWVWSSSFRMALAAPQTGCVDAAHLRLVADMDARAAAARPSSGATSAASAGHLNR